MKPNLEFQESQARISDLDGRVEHLEAANGLLENALRRNSRVFRALLRHNRGGIALTGPDRRIVRVVKGLTGLDVDSLLGVPIETLVVPADRQIVLDAYRGLLQDHYGKIDIVVQVPRADGIIVSHAATLTDMLDDPDVQGIVWNYSAQPSLERLANHDLSNPAEELRVLSSLMAAESRFHRLAESGVIGIFEGNSSGQILTGNAAFLKMLGYTAADLRAGLIRWDRMTVPGFEPINRLLSEQLAAGRMTAPMELEYFRADGSQLPVLVGLASLEGTVDETRAIGFMLDRSHERETRDALRKSEELFRQFAEHIREVFWMMDLTESKVIYVSPAYEQVWGRTCQSLYADHSSWMDTIHPDDRRGAEEVSARQLRGEVVENEYRIVQPSGAVRWIRDRAFPVRDAAGNIVRLAGVAEDTTERKLSEARLVHQTLYDELTDLPNRRLFRQKLAQAIAECEPEKHVAVFFIDLDQFKFVNDTLGHLAGDDLLKQIAGRLQAICRPVGTLARFGGDEFTLVVPGIEDPESARGLGELLIQCLDGPFRIEGRDLFAGASIGVSFFPVHGTQTEVLKRHANLAMHEAKRAGKKQIRFFTPELADVALERLEMEIRLRKALAQSEFRLQFQPQFSPGSEVPGRFEALLRWLPAEGPAIPPGKFIPLAEENGLIVSIGTWVLEESCRRCALWQMGDLTGTGVAVNVSAVQFASPDFVETVARALESAALPPQLLEIELTESVFVRDMAASARKLMELRSLGVTVALDDFGTGYSSLSYLQNLPIDTLKIDRTFLLQSESRQEGAAVMQCVVDLAHTLGLRVVGEGAETPDQLRLLSNLGCDLIQGFLLGSPSFEVCSPASRRPIMSGLQQDPGGNE